MKNSTNVFVPGNEVAILDDEKQKYLKAYIMKRVGVEVTINGKTKFDDDKMPEYMLSLGRGKDRVIRPLNFIHAREVLRS